MENIQIRRYYSQSQKRLIISEHLEQAIPISQLARKYNIHAITLYKWKRTMTNENENPNYKQMLQELIEQNEALKRENKQLKKVVADVSVQKDILNDALEIAKKNAFLKQLGSLKKSKKQKNTK